MSVRCRNYTLDDYRRVDDFLIRHYKPGNQDGNWVQSAWEYMRFHGLLDCVNMKRFGIWEDNGEIVAVTHYELFLGEAYFQFHPAYRHLRSEMLDYAEANLAARREENGRKFVKVFVNDNDEEFLALVAERGYERRPH